MGGGGQRRRRCRLGGQAARYPSFDALYYRRSSQDWKRIPTVRSHLRNTQSSGERAAGFRLTCPGFVAPHLILISSICKRFTHLKFLPTNVRASPRGLDAPGVPPYVPYCIRAFDASTHRSAIHRHDLGPSSRLSRETALHREHRRASTRPPKKSPSDEHRTSV